MNIALEPIGLTLEDAASYIRVEPEEFLKLVEMGLMPRPIKLGPGIERFHRKKIAAMLDDMQLEKDEEVDAAQYAAQHKGVTQ